MTYRVRLSHQAQIQLFNHADWWSQRRSLEEAAEWLVGIEAAMRGLSSNPERHGYAPEADRYGVEVRQLNYGLRRKKTHRAVFVIRENEVVVIAIRHLAQDDLSIVEIRS